MSISEFIKKENIDTIWDVIIDEDIFKFLSRDNQDNVLQIFTKNIKSFYNAEGKTTQNLIDMNKKYIILILSYIKKNFPQQLPSKLKISNEPLVKESITYEEIQNEKKSQFEKDFIKRQEEFTNSMSIPLPEVPDFSDKFTDGPISEMEKKIKEITAKRNYDIELINNANKNSIENADNWLKPQETSVKSEKLSKNNSTSKNVSWGENISLDNNNISLDNNNISLDNNNISLDHDNVEFDLNNLGGEGETDFNIFSKLKKVPSNLENIKENESVEKRLLQIEKKLDNYSNKMDLILDLLQHRENI